MTDSSGHSTFSFWVIPRHGFQEPAWLGQGALSVVNGYWGQAVPWPGFGPCNQDPTVKRQAVLRAVLRFAMDST